MHRLPLFLSLGLMATCAIAGSSLPVRAAEEHFYTLINVDKTSAAFAEDSAKRGRDGSIRMTVLRVYEGGPIAYATYQMMLNCAAKKAQTLEGMNYSRDGRPSVIEGEAEATVIKTGTLGAVLRGYICDGVDPYPRSKTIKSLADARERAVELIAVEKTR